MINDFPMLIEKKYEFNYVNDFKLKMIETYGLKFATTIFVIIGYIFDQVKKAKKVFLTKNQIRKFLFEKVSFSTIKKAKKILKDYFGIYQKKIERKSIRECKYEWVIEKEYLDKNPELKSSDFWADFNRLVFDNKFRIDKNCCPKLLKFRIKKFWFQNLSAFFNKNKKKKIELSETYENYADNNNLESTDLDFFENFNFNSM